jgi:GT2 family glycosyltransferase
MAFRMSSTTPQVADTDNAEENVDAPRIRVLLSVVDGSDVDAALAVVRRQAYEPSPEIVIVGAERDGTPFEATLEEAIASTESSFEYLWLLHTDARPRPDALAALVAEAERNEAALAGSKLLKAGSMDELESVGGATDVFGEPYSGIDEGEIDLQQYDVVREVAFVQSASMLVRRDLAQGLRGLDPLLPPVAAGLDFSQRTRLAGGRVISVPSSEVYHQARCEEPDNGLREQAGRLRAMVTAYSPLTLLWVIPYDFLVSVVDSLANILLLRWRAPLGHLYSWSWNLVHLPSTISQRRRLRTVRSERDEELFRFHTKGSVRLRDVGGELSARVLSVFDDDQALARGSRRVWSSPGIWGAMVAAIVVIIGARSILLSGMSNSGFSFPFEPPSVALRRWFGGWNDSGLGSGSPIHPSVGLTGLISFIWFGAEGAARTVATVSLAVFGIVGVGRLAGRVGVRGPGRYLAGLVLVAGPGTALLVDRGSWLALAAAAVLPWAVRSVFLHPSEEGRSLLSRLGWALILAMILASLSPALVVAPLLVVLVWRLFGGRRARFGVAMVTLAGAVVALPFLLGDPGWLTDPSRRLGVTVGDLWPVLVAVAAIPAFTLDGELRAMSFTGGVLGLGSLAAARALELGPGLEEAVLVMASFGTALVVAAAVNSLSRNVLRLTAVLGGLALLVMSIPGLANGRLGLPAGDVNDRLSFATTLAGPEGVGRILHISVDSTLIPGEVRAGPGLWYRVLDGEGTTNDQLWLPSPLDGDEELADVIEDIASGAELRPGERLSSFAIDWVVIEGPQTPLDEVLVAQLDLVPVPLDPDSRVFENHSASPLAGTSDLPWMRSGVGFAGEPSTSVVPLAVNFDDGWAPGAERASWFVEVDGSEGRADFTASQQSRYLEMAVIGLLAAGLVLIVVGRVRS